MRRFFLFHLVLFFLCSIFPLTASADVPHRVFNERELPVQRLQVPFVQNLGQAADEVAYYARTFGGTLFVTKEGQMVLAIPFESDGETRLGVVREEVLGASPTVPEGRGISPTRISSFIGNDPARWQTEVPTFNSVDMGEVYEGIELRLQAYGKSVEKIFTVQPGADPSKILINTDSPGRLAIAEDGTLKVQTALGEVIYSAPVAYQENDAGRQNVRVAYAVQGNTYGFELGPYDRERPLVIDPILLATYLGGTGNDDGYSLAVADNGHVYVTGRTQSTDFPGVDGSSAQSTFNGSTSYTDVFVAHLDPSLGTLYRTTYLGGTLSDEPGYGSGGGPTIAVHPTNGSVYVTGLTQSANFPAMSAGFDSTINDGSGDAFVARLNPDLTSIQAATYYGGGSMDLGTALTIDPEYGDIYITGRTQSASLPGTAGNFDSTMSGTWDGFVALFSADLSILRDATYVGGSGTDWPFGMTTPTDSDHPDYGSVFVTGQTYSSDFPATAGGLQETLDGYTDAFVIRLSSSLAAGEATYLGGAVEETGFGVQVHPDSGDIYVCGATSSADFPNVSGGAQAAQAGTGYNDAFVAILSPGLDTLGQSTYLGGSNSENNSSLFIDPGSGDIYLAGTTFSSDFPGTEGGAQPDSAGDNDVFAARLSEDLTTLYQATYVGGTSRDNGYAIGSLAASNGIYITGLTWSGNFPGMSDTYSPQPEHGGGSRDAFVVRLDSTLAASYDPDISVLPLSLDFGTIAVGDTRSLPVMIVNEGAGDLTIDLIQLEDGTFFTADITRPYMANDPCSDYEVSPDAVVLPAFENCAIHVIFTPPAEAAYSDTLTIGSDDPDEEYIDIPLEGAGGSGPDISLEPGSYDFGPVLVGKGGSTIFTVENLGDLPLTVYDVFLSDEVNFRFSISLTDEIACDSFLSEEGLFELPAYESCIFQVGFIPQEPGEIEETLEITSNDPNHASVFASLSGGTDIGLVPIGFYEVISVETGGLSPRFETFTLTNHGSIAYTVKSISLIDAPRFSLSMGLCPNPPFQLDPEQSCEFSIRYDPEGYSDDNVNGNMILSFDPGDFEISIRLAVETAKFPNEDSGLCSISEPGDKTGSSHVVLLITLLGGLWAWRRKRLN